ncbi:response regulator transcription factor [Virgibacillus halodenitrificans]|uniref:DNA-binding response regulator n=1 Tax=Virgibacillus halodenitrificans TaxID=1482 RepID=A0AAC9IXQ9_VIRHA|nr:response regulator transcription factor [Virgibacillus halodenitrificans]APC47070.1 DNA-binding response regulator [Virgibacillus halodenitrificans]MBD1223120.1 response regulator transcription factor [Virgibacillus halodenitrificans]MCG1027326.1 response regulator transcription factor [Virgibacillus halodenitrificans]MCJ0930377.1 response regulator transcription factor [Virgibacillus halodenitrificans]MEC2159172.1 response regulator transcription factor [Virgibacillus halodenitrificans]
MGNRIGVVEDDVNIQNIVSAYLKKEGYDVIISDTAEAAWEIWETYPPDMWILDIMLPGMDGYEFCKKIRNESEVPIIIISAKDEEIDKILGLELGGDDYLTKPFSPRELVARVKRLFKRAFLKNNNEEPTQEKVKIDQLLINKEERRIFYKGEEYEVTTKEFDMLLLLVENVNRAFSREELLIKIWGDDYFGSDRAVDDLVKRLRKKLPDLPLETVWGFGYRLRYGEET